MVAQDVQCTWYLDWNQGFRQDLGNWVCKKNWATFLVQLFKKPKKCSKNPFSSSFCVCIFCIYFWPCIFKTGCDYHGQHGWLPKPLDWMLACALKFGQASKLCHSLATKCYDTVNIYISPQILLSEYGN